MLPFEFDGWQHPVPDVFAFRIIEHFDVVEHILPCVGAGLVGSSPYPFPFEQIEEALRDSVIVAVPASAHRVLQVVSFEE